MAPNAGSERPLLRFASTGRSDSSVMLGGSWFELAALCGAVAALLAACAAQELPEAGDGPIKAAMQLCPLTEDERVPGLPDANAALGPYLNCARGFGASRENVQAASWVRDWSGATDCLHRCDREGIDALAHESMRTGLRYIVAVSLGEPESVGGSCLGAQRSMLVALDERMNHLASWQSLSRTQCKELKLSAATETQLRSAKEDRDRLLSNINAFKSK